MVKLLKWYKITVCFTDCLKTKLILQTVLRKADLQPANLGNCSRRAMPHALLFQAYSLSALSVFKRQAGLIYSRLIDIAPAVGKVGALVA